MSWFWIGAAIAAPTACGFLIALPFWLGRQTMMGNLVGAGVMFLGAVLSIAREYVELSRMRQACLAARTLCDISPDDFTRYSVYAGIAFLEVFLLFTVSLLAEERMRRRAGIP
jgi:ABC-type Na+ efflux pump permease subunit